MKCHRGKVVERTATGVKVAVLFQSACSQCQAKSNCLMSEAKQDVLEIETDEAFSIGQPVVLSLTQELGMKAVFFGYGLPLILLVGALFCFSLFFSEAVSAVAALACLLPYYGLLYLLREHFEREFRIKIDVAED